jgi:hypothetical protein
VTVTSVLPAFDPAVGLTAVTVGDSNVNFALLVAALVPPGVVTLTGARPVVPVGDTAVIDVGESMV